MKLYSQKSIEQYALYNIVEITFYDDSKIKGWMVPASKENGYYILPHQVGIISNDKFFIKRSQIKQIRHLTNGVIVPRECETTSEELW